MTEADQILQLRQECKEKSILLRQMQATIDKQARSLDKADGWYKYFQDRPDMVFKGAGILVIMGKNDLKEQ